MKINHLNQLQQTGAKPLKDAGAAGEVARQQAQKQQSGTPAEGQDRVELSGLAKDLQRASEIARETPDVRTDKVAALKEQVQSGKYDVDAKKVASKMIVESLSELT